MSDVNHVLVTVASWEERFSLGFERLLNEFTTSNILMYFVAEYAERTEEPRNHVIRLCKESKRQIESLELSFAAPARSWQVLYESISSGIPAGASVVVDLSTMPREVIWMVLDLLQERGATIKYVYNPPRSYDLEWLTRDPGRP
ncbi:MAG: hypothetical protein WC712_12525, partial [Candidatus Brocadiia bacterium]